MLRYVHWKRQLKVCIIGGIDMTTYTKTQLIDLAIDKLGESPDWMVDSVCVAVSTESNTVWGSGKFILISKKGQAFWEGIVPDRWQLVCTREEFEQRVKERKCCATTNPTNTDTTIPTDGKAHLTERQQAGLKLWRAINFNDPMTDDEVLGYCRFEDYCLPFDQGMLK